MKLNFVLLALLIFVDLITAVEQSYQQTNGYDYNRLTGIESSDFSTDLLPPSGPTGVNGFDSINTGPSGVAGDEYFRDNNNKNGLNDNENFEPTGTQYYTPRPENNLVPNFSSFGGSGRDYSMGENNFDGDNRNTLGLNENKYNQFENNDNGDIGLSGKNENKLNLNSIEPSGKNEDKLGSVKDLDKGDSSRSIFKSGNDDLDDDGDYSAIPGVPGNDYPIYSEIPKTKFSCVGRDSGFYADVEAQCQVFHRCADNIKYDFLCPNGTIFHQGLLVCVWWNRFDCSTAPSLFGQGGLDGDFSSRQSKLESNNDDDQNGFRESSRLSKVANIDNDDNDGFFISSNAENKNSNFNSNQPSSLDSTSYGGASITAPSGLYLPPKLPFIYSQRKGNWLEVNIPNQGKIIGKEVALIRTKRIRVFYGIPFASPPVNDLRFSPPMFETLPSWKTVRNATNLPPVCMQSKIENDDDTNQLYDLLRKAIDDDTEMSEDCLYLNVYSPIPKQKNNVKLPVIIWLHPGSFISGNPNQYNPYWVVYKKNVIIVTAAYRLNIFGFFTSLDNEAVGNYGMMDQIAAMVWTKNKISAFGGDPDNISLMGHDSGAISITLHLISPLTAFYHQQFNNKLFSKCIILSGNSLSTNAIQPPKSYEQMRQILNDTADYFGCSRAPTSQLMQCLRSADSKALVEYSKNFQWLPMVDESYVNESLPFLPSRPHVLYQTSDIIQVPLLLGFTENEEAFEILSMPTSGDQLFEKVIESVISNDLEDFNTSSCDYKLVYESVLLIYDNLINKEDSAADFQKELVQFATDKTYAAPNFQLISYILSRYPNVPIFMYRFDSRPASSLVFKSSVPDWVTLPHFYDLIYVWGMPFWYALENSLMNWDQRDKVMSDIIMMFFVNFFKSSSPTNNVTDDYRIRWDPYSNENGSILLIANQTFIMSNTKNFNYKVYRYWNNFYPKLIESLAQFCTQIDSLESLSTSVAFQKNRIEIWFYFIASMVIFVLI